MAHRDQTEEGLSISAIAAGGIFALAAIGSVFWIFHPGADHPGPNP